MSSKNHSILRVTLFQEAAELMLDPKWRYLQEVWIES
jgi:hypothetical protein